MVAEGPRWPEILQELTTVDRYRQDFYDGKEIIAIEDRVIHIVNLALESET